MSKILTSGCGITFPGERPTWVNVLKICGLNITDLSGPAISNTLILNQLVSECTKTRYDYVICQLTSKRKLDIELNEQNKKYMDSDPLRNFSYKGFWPSSVSEDNEIKQMYYKYLYSPKLDEDDTILKLLLLQHICKQHQTELFIMQGYKMHWTNDLIQNINMDFEMKENTPKYKYKIRKGICKIKGGVAVLKELGYPEHIIEDACKNVDKL